MPGSLFAILWCLRIVIAFQCLGLAGRYLFSASESESDIFEYLYFDIGWPEHWAQLVDDVGAYGCLLSMIVLIVAGCLPARRSGKQQRRKSAMVARYLEYAALIFIGAWFFLLAAAHMARGEAYAEFAIGEQAVRFATPLAMIMLLCCLTASSLQFLAKTTSIMLTVAVVATFTVHGYVALQLHGPFVDLILLTDMRLFQFGFEQSTAETLLRIIGWADIVVGALLLITRWRVIAVYMIVWGLITAASRMTAFGSVAWPETFIRAANAGAPLVLLLLYQFLMPKKDGIQSGIARD